MAQKKSVTGTIARAMLVIVMISILIFGYAFVQLTSTLNDAEALNVAGSMRMQSYRLAHDIQVASPDISDHILLFERSIYSPSMKALQQWPVPSDITQDYYHLIKRWHELKFWLVNQQRDEYLLAMPAYVAQIDAFVFKLQSFSEQKWQQLAWGGGLGLSGIFLTSIFVVWYVRREIVHPLRALVIASEQIQAHSFDIELNVVSDNDMGVLTRTFNTTAKALGRLYRGLEQAVDEKTHRLQHANHSLEVLYRSSSELMAARITADNFAAILEQMVSLEGIDSVRLEVYTDAEKPMIIEKSSATAGECWSASQDLQLDGHTLGKLSWNWSLPCPDQALLDNFVRILSRAIYYNQAQRQAEQLLLFEERATIARELHDSLAQSLSYLKIQVSLLKKFQSDATAQMHPQREMVMGELEQGLSDAYAQLRELLTTFRISIRQGSFGVALQDMVAQLQSQSQANIELSNALSSIELTAHEQVHLLQLIREATINAIKHADASTIAIRCVEHGGCVMMTVTDDGLGIQPKEYKQHHFGLTIMKERAERLNGELTVTSMPNEGCEIKLTYPRNKEFHNDAI